MKRKALMGAGLAGLLAWGCSEKAPPSQNKGSAPIQATRVDSPAAYDDVVKAIDSLEGHPLTLEKHDTHDGYRVTARVYTVRWDAAQKIYAVEITDPRTNGRLYAATPVGKEGPFMRAPDSSSQFTYTPEELRHIFDETITQD